VENQALRIFFPKRAREGTLPPSIFLFIFSDYL